MSNTFPTLIQRDLIDGRGDDAGEEMAKRRAQTEFVLKDLPALMAAMGRAPAVAASRGAPLAEEIFDLSGSARDIPRTCYGIIYRTAGSNPLGKLNVVPLNGGVPFPLSPGESIRGVFDGFRIEAASGSATSGYARIVTPIDPAAWLDLQQSEADGLVTASYSAAYNSAVNVPSAATDGISLEGVTGLRAQVDAGNGNTIAGGTGRWWVRSTTSGLWSLISDVAVNATTLATGIRASHTPDLLTTVGYGRAFFEVLSATHSGGAGAFTVYLEGIRK